jgi:hypothetical protein
MQVFTVPTLTPALVREDDLLAVLIDCFSTKLLEGQAAPSSPGWQLDCSQPALASRLYAGVGDDLRYTLSHLEVAHLLVHERRILAEHLLEVFAVAQAMNVQRRKTDVHVEHESDAWKVRLTSGLRVHAAVTRMRTLRDGAAAETEALSPDALHCVRRQESEGRCQRMIPWL